ncbi:MAG: rhodanese-like domain-containing protein [Gammaproteobacteria bacterium]|nr:rhodanese-like domain-containing protein [Gammaproteobacteria bacterium]
MEKTLQDFLTEARKRVNNITPDELMELVDANEDFLLIDVREESEYAHSHIPNSINIPRGTLEGAADRRCPKRHKDLCEARQRVVVVYCQTGGRSSMATDVLLQMGFSRAVNLAGGIVNWEAEDYPVVHAAGYESTVPGMELS